VYLNFMNLSGTFAYSYHVGHYDNTLPGWTLLKVGLNPPSLTYAPYPVGYDPYGQWLDTLLRMEAVLRQTYFSPSPLIPIPAYCRIRYLP
jgi:hypothetical protein